MINYYDILEIDIDAGDDEIKKAYRRLIRKYPPERFPEEFKKILNAYESLKEPRKRELYKTLIEAEIFYENLLKKGDMFFNSHNYREAAKIYEQLIRDKTEMDFLNLRLGICYRELYEFNRAIKAFERFLQKNPYHIDTIINLGHIYRRQEEMDMARKYYMRAYNIQPQNQKLKENMPLIAKHYISEREYLKAIDFLKACMKYNGDLYNLEYRLILMDVYIGMENMDNVLDVLNEIMSIIEGYDIAKLYMAKEISLRGQRLFSLGFYFVAEKVMVKVLRLDQSEDTFNIYKGIKNYNEVLLTRENFFKDPSIFQELKELVSFYINSIEDKDEKVKNNNKLIDKKINKDPEQVMIALNYIRDNYFSIYRDLSDKYDRIYEKAMVRQKRIKWLFW